MKPNYLHGSSFLLEITIDGQTIVVRTAVFSGRFIEIEQSLSPLPVIKFKFSSKI